MYNVIYYLIFAILTTLLIIYIENKYAGTYETKTVEIDGITYMVPDIKAKEYDPILIKNIGSKLVCESMEEIMGQKIKYNSYVPEAKSMISGEYLYSDCYEPNTHIMADYKPHNMYSYEAGIYQS